MVIICNSHIDDLGDDDRYQQIKYNFQKLEKKEPERFLFCSFEDILQVFAFLFLPPFPYFSIINLCYYTPMEIIRIILFLMYDNIILLLPGTEVCGMIEVWFFV